MSSPQMMSASDTSFVSTYDPDYEFDAPRGMDFNALAMTQDTNCDEWFGSDTLKRVAKNHFHSKRSGNFDIEEEPKRKTYKRSDFSSLTVPVEFNWHGRPRSPKESVEPWYSFIEQVKKFEKTPPRYRRPSRNQQFDPSKHRLDTSKVKLTVPQGFHFQTSDRTEMRPQQSILTSEERALMEMQNLPKFRALPFDRRVVDYGGTMGIKRIDKPELTVPKAFDFATDYRLRSHQNEEEEQPRTQSKRGFGELTAPKSPLLQTRLRAETRHITDIPPEEIFSTEFRARAVPSTTFNPPSMRLQEHRVTEPAPFNLKTEERRYEAERKWNDKLVQEDRRAQEERYFRARPMPYSEEPDFVPSPASTSLTNPQPFQLETQNRGHVFEEKWKAQLDEEERRAKEAMQFRARPIVQKPFHPNQNRSLRPLTEITNFTLKSDERALKRRAWEASQSQKEVENAQAKAEMQRQEDLRQQRELKALRDTMVHKPRDVYRGRPMEIRASDEKLTMPQSPMLRTRVRGLRA
eukprot:TRINITY_DN10641_c0_g1_i1.p1 TRINITY_DN10641_c0_g1~~TRINITY_DN10641_c0_g1_i1.p1  ORF type:complete len:520 (+),score=177.65 TRINITY_DN10641_c0_g1_i1:104-1663(+)